MAQAVSGVHDTPPLTVTSQRAKLQPSMPARQLAGCRMDFCMPHLPRRLTGDFARLAAEGIGHEAAPQQWPRVPLSRQTQLLPSQRLA